LTGHCQQSFHHVNYLGARAQSARASAFRYNAPTPPERRQRREAALLTDRERDAPAMLRRAEFVAGV